MITMHPGEFITDLCGELNINQAELADRLEVDRSTLSRLINGKADMSPMMAVRLSKVFDCSAEYWMEMQTQHNLRIARKELEGFNPKVFSE